MRMIKELKGGSLSKTVVMSTDKSQWVRKYISIEKNREYGLVRWQSQLRKVQILRKEFPTNVLPILGAGVDQDCYYFDMPYLSNSQNLHEAIISGASSQKILERLIDIIKTLADCKLPASPGSFAIYLNEELKRPLLCARKELENSPNYLSTIERSYFKHKLDNILAKIDRTISDHGNRIIPESLTHGNFTLENAVWDADQENVFMIDFYAETYCESILGDIAQIYQSSKSGYETINEYFSTSGCSITEYPYEKLPNELTIFSQNFEKIISQEPWYDPTVVELFRASQFTRMFPFKLVNNPRGGFLFINHALDVLGGL